jgi:tetratricopeptide (TPR) repeat protein
MIDGVSNSLAIEVLEHVEGILQSHCSVDDVLNRLLIAPLRDSQPVGRLAKLALSEGLATVGGLLDRLVDLQPLLRRLAETWLRLAATEFTDLPTSREAFWQNLSTSSLLTKLLDANGKTAFKNAWATLAFKEVSVSGRRAIIHIGNLLADAVYPTSLRRAVEVEQAFDSEQLGDDFGWGSNREDFSSRGAYMRALKQVHAIAEAVSQGKDRSARRFVIDLIEDQSRASSREHLIKSLCNIAQKCAFMFRADFERQCLDQALEIDPNDAWSVIQMGNHLKRVGQFDAAIEMLERAANSEHARVATSSIADVWCEAGKYEKAVDVYKAIPAWQDVCEIRTGLADIRRYKGEIAEAISEYDTILVQWPDADRAAAGKADVFKQLGRFEEAVAIYDSLIYQPVVDSFAKLIYRMAKCAVLKQANRLDDAYQLADNVVRTAPFCMLARVHRASILALLGQGDKALSSLPSISFPPSFGTWITGYCRGLMLLKLKRYRPARKLLVERLNSAFLASDNQAVIRLGAAFALLYKDDLDSAAAVLSKIRDVRDYYTQYVYDVLELHVCAAREDKERAAEIAERLETIGERDVVVARVLTALRAHDFSAAKRYELELLLRLAA